MVLKVAETQQHAVTFLNAHYLAHIFSNGAKSSFAIETMTLKAPITELSDYQCILCFASRIVEESDDEETRYGNEALVRYVFGVCHQWTEYVVEKSFGLPYAVTSSFGKNLPCPSSFHTNS